jgi:class 3 adenylate cyclase
LSRRRDQRRICSLSVVLRPGVAGSGPDYFPLSGSGGGLDQDRLPTARPPQHQRQRDLPRRHPDRAWSPQRRGARPIIDGLIASHRGRIFNTAGDSVVADFASAVDAVQCAVAVQAAIATEDAGGDEPMQLRIGVHVGDIMVDGDNLLGDGVNIAARLEALAEPGAICVSATARDHIGNKLPLAFDDLGDQQVIAPD